ncbi:30S ribosomal protein S8 [Patulibacter brassicae]|jgi:small subunit ribosomal protein S8|uniref:Small ribosomal subunit protein uS8 n=1 Tax=Patulibacter brassicae TaxID=1705717 RepID=A0ABU4VM34_9ACTN|nr:30S ribosomal protein S8 [Patulibacter brassicae]MDX8152904.1 30S ribosomal protein S8 [Patulibacter brassicae]
MSTTDPIADLLTRIRNAITAAHRTVDVPASKAKVEIARILKEQGYISDVEVRPSTDTPGELLHITLKYTKNRSSAITGLRRVSRPGQRLYVGAGEVPKSLGGLGTVIMSTSSGIMTGHDARAAGVGGEVWAEVW